MTVHTKFICSIDSMQIIPIYIQIRYKVCPQQPCPHGLHGFLGSSSSWGLFHILKSPAEPILWDGGLTGLVSTFHFVLNILDDLQVSLPFVEASISKNALRIKSKSVILLYLAPHKQSTIIVVLPEDTVRTLVREDSIVHQAASGGDVLEVDGTIAHAPHPLLVLFPSLRPALHSVRLHICRQVRLPLLLVLDEERFRVFAVGTQAKTLPVQIVVRVLVGIGLDQKDENN